MLACVALRAQASTQRATQTVSNTDRALQNRKLQTQEQLVDAGVVGELGMERRGEDLALAQADHIAVHRRFDGGGRSDFGHSNGPRMNTSGKSLSTMSAGASCGTCSPGATTTAESPEEEPKSAVAANEPSPT